ncbi:ParB N-terminal domain-containing protein [Myceligenerans pegani]|uniref:ParB N-terminal domain-containing protein n=1 Tax=Myceligenerans pegani TaxID=2776917 RepID=A0ABR9N5N9_9MICO|nr:ParB N-terminal domain-containing protein [Myceligenerans sp. TRM 65318]MBE1878985.1 ParB N-terminal domain-containing protein [Myceligenerans sp. TRM 65318]MBE3021256.1 ParB N-terminal domain-containing protein [Myceligenerans sp. TRM 65318]
MGERADWLDVAVSAITVGIRHRRDLGDLNALASSINKFGMLQPITVTPDLVLVVGWRRLEAVKLLGWDRVRGWVRSGLSDRAGALLAEQDENTVRLAYSPTEQASLYRELKQVLREEAARRQEVSWFGTGTPPAAVASAAGSSPTGSEPGAGAGAGPVNPQEESDQFGGADSAPREQRGESGKVRDQASEKVAGRKAHQVLERIGTLMDLSVDPAQPEHIRALATEAVERINDGGRVAPEWEAVTTALAEHTAARSRDTSTTDPSTTDTEASHPAGSPAPVRPAVSRAALRGWVQSWRHTDVLLDAHDPQVLGPALPQQKWEEFLGTLRRTQHWADKAQIARSQDDTTPHTAPNTGETSPVPDRQAPGAAEPDRLGAHAPEAATAESDSEPTTPAGEIEPDTPPQTQFDARFSAGARDENEDAEEDAARSDDRPLEGPAADDSPAHAPERAGAPGQIVGAS